MITSFTAAFAPVVDEQVEADDVDHSKDRKGRGLGAVLCIGIPGHKSGVRNGQRWGRLRS